jgi:hypothetical protein
MMAMTGFGEEPFRTMARCVSWAGWSVGFFFLWLFAPAAGWAASPQVLKPSQVVEPGLTYGAAGDLPLPKTILFSAGPDAIIADAEEWARRGVGAFFLDFVARDWSSDVWAADQKPWTAGESDETFQKVTGQCNLPPNRFRDLSEDRVRPSIRVVQ